MYKSPELLKFEDRNGVNRIDAPSFHFPQAAAVFLLFSSSEKSISMKRFFIAVFYHFQCLFKDEVSSMAVVAYFITINIFTILGCCKFFFQHSHLNATPFIYAFMIMFFSALFTRFVLLSDVMYKEVIEKLRRNFVKKNDDNFLVTLLYAVGSFLCMLVVV